jgi:hypothetical protein
MIDQPNIAADAEIELETAARILGLSMPLLLRRLDDGRLRQRLRTAAIWSGERTF